MDGTRYHRTSRRLGRMLSLTGHDSAAYLVVIASSALPAAPRRPPRATGMEAFRVKVEGVDPRRVCWSQSTHVVFRSLPRRRLPSRHGLRQEEFLSCTHIRLPAYAHRPETTLARPAGSRCERALCTSATRLLLLCHTWNHANWESALGLGGQPQCGLVSAAMARPEWPLRAQSCARGRVLR